MASFLATQSVSIRSYMHYIPVSDYYKILHVVGSNCSKPVRTAVPTEPRSIPTKLRPTRTCTLNLVPTFKY